jgi:hypothetical protein
MLVAAVKHRVFLMKKRISAEEATILADKVYDAYIRGMDPDQVPDRVPHRVYLGDTVVPYAGFPITAECISIEFHYSVGEDRGREAMLSKEPDGDGEVFEIDFDTEIFEHPHFQVFYVAIHVDEPDGSSTPIDEFIKLDENRLARLEVVPLSTDNEYAEEVGDYIAERGMRMRGLLKHNPMFADYQEWWEGKFLNKRLVVSDLHPFMSSLQKVWIDMHREAQ